MDEPERQEGGSIKSISQRTLWCRRALSPRWPCGLEEWEDMQRQESTVAEEPLRIVEFERLHPAGAPEKGEGREKERTEM